MIISSRPLSVGALQMLSVILEVVRFQYTAQKEMSQPEPATFLTSDREEIL